MDYNLIKKVRFFSGNEFKDITHVAEGIVYADRNIKSSHWSIYSVYLISSVLTCLSFSFIVRNKEVPFVKVSELKSVLELSTDNIKEFILTNSITIPLSVYLSKEEFNDADEMIKKFLHTQPKEADSIVEYARESLNKFIEIYNIVLNEN